MFYFSVREIFLYLIILLCHNDTLFVKHFSLEFLSKYAIL